MLPRRRTGGHPGLQNLELFPRSGFVVGRFVGRAKLPVQPTWAAKPTTIAALTAPSNSFTYLLFDVFIQQTHSKCLLGSKYWAKEEVGMNIYSLVCLRSGGRRRHNPKFPVFWKTERHRSCQTRGCRGPVSGGGEAWDGVGWAAAHRRGLLLVALKGPDLTLKAMAEESEGGLPAAVFGKTVLTVCGE